MSQARFKPHKSERRSEKERRADGSHPAAFVETRIDDSANVAR
jgi:hypothetical protein